MDSSSSIRPEASTVHRAASTGEEVLKSASDSRSADGPHATDGPKASSHPEAIRQPKASSQPEASSGTDGTSNGRRADSAEHDLEAADTVIRQDFLSGMMAGGSSRRLATDPTYQGERHGSSRSRVEAGSAGSQNTNGPVQQTPASLTRELQGQRLNHFELLEQIGGGGMGAVFRARDDRLGRTVAVKVVPFAAGDPDLQRRFRNEAQSAAKLDHPLIARVFEVGNDGPWYYIVFEYIDGSNIRDMVLQDGPLSLDDAVYYTCQVAEAIGHASKRGIVHRDIKPSNVVVTESSSIKLVDMGLARSESFETSEDLTASGVTLGTFDYISPEQAHDPRLADIRSDLYSLGCTFFYMLTGSPPFPGGTMLQKLLNHGNAAIPDVRDQRDDASEDLNAILRKMLAKQPEQRYQDSQVLIADLQELAQRENLARSRGVDVVTVKNDGRMTEAFLRHLPWVVAALLLLVSAGWLELSAWQQRSEFTSKLAATVPSSAPESPPVRKNGDDGDFANRQSSSLNRPAAPIRFPSPQTMQFAATPESIDRQTRSGPNDPNSPESELEDLLDPTSLLAKDETVPNLESDTRSESYLSPGSQVADSQVDRPLANSFGGTLGGPLGAATDSIASENLALSSGPTPGSNGTSPGLIPSTAVSPTTADRAMLSVDDALLDRLPSDPPSLKGFPFPANTDSSRVAESADGARSMAPVIDGLVDFNASSGMFNASSGMRTDQTSSQPVGSSLIDPNSDATGVEIDLIRIVDAATFNDNLLRQQARQKGIALVTTFPEALKLADQSDSDRIEIDTPVLMSEPFVVQQDDLVIASSVPGGTAIVFRSTNEIDMQRSEMISIEDNRIEFVDLHFYWTVPVTETDGGALLSMSDNRQVRLTDCSITIDNPSRRDDIFAFNITTNLSTRPNTFVDGRVTTEVAEGSIDILPLVSIELYNVIVRGQISMLSMDVSAELQLLWENGLLAVSKRMIETGGSAQRPQPKSGSIRLSLQRLTAFTPQGLIQMRLGSGNEYPVEIDRRAEESVFVVEAGSPHVEITGTLREDRETPWLRIRGASNAYETDATLSDPLLVVRDTFGQSKTITMRDLASNDPTEPGNLPWADDRTPRWVVRWSDPLPVTMATSRMIPADFRQDGSLFAGFQERSLPKLPMQRTFDIPPYE